MSNEQAARQESDHRRVFPQLDAFLDEDMTAEQAAPVAEHVAECEICRQRLVELRGVERIYQGTLNEGGPTPGYRARLIGGLKAEGRKKRT
jgi:predicted anti-sigma-YlaC factor YlaD